MASRLFTVDLDLGLNKAKRFIFEDFSSAPTGTTGRVIYWTAGDSAANHLKVYNGTAWKTVAYTDDVPDISISLDAATGFTVTGSPAGASGTLTFEWDEVAPGYVLAGLAANTSPAPGNSIPTFRALVDADIPVEIARVDDVNTSLEDYILLSEKGEPLGVAELNASGTVPAEQLDLSSYVTLTGAELLSNKSYEGVLTFEDEDGEALTDAEISLSSVMSGGSLDTSTFKIAHTGDFSRLEINSKNVAISATNEASLFGVTSYVQGTSDVVLSGFSGGEYLGSVASGNQIATIGDLEALDAYDITATQISNWDTAYGWGDHSTEGYLTTAVESISNVDGNITFSTSTGSVTADLATDVEIAGDLIVQGDFTVNGDVTTLNTATMNVEDNIFVLNSNVTGTPSVNAGLEVERGEYDNASIYWNETLNKWWVSTPADAATSGTPAQQIARKVVRTTTGTTHSINHGLVTEDVTVNCWLDGEQVEVSVVITDENTVTVTTNTSITDLKTVVIG
jgi:hypothetical protein